VTVQEEFLNVYSIVSNYGRTNGEDGEETSQQHDDSSNSNTTTPILSEHDGDYDPSSVIGTSSYYEQQSVLDSKWLIPVVVIATLLCCCIIAVHCRGYGGCRKTKDVEVCVSWDTEYVEEEQERDVGTRQSTFTDHEDSDHVEESRSVNDIYRDEETSPGVDAGIPKEETAMEILRISFPDNRKNKWIFF
jgi:hypothetical protein